MSKERSKGKDYLVYLAVRLVLCVISILSFESACRLAGLFAWLVHRLDRRHRLVADENLQHAYGEAMTPEQRERTIRAVYTHFCTLLIELIHMPRRLQVHTWKKYGELIGGGEQMKAMISGKPVLIATGHLGNWEIAGYILGLAGFHTYAIARTLDNPYLDVWLRKLREKTGQKILAKKGEFDDIQGVLAEGGILATLADQDAGQRGVFVDFFNRPASTHKAVALLALEYNVTILVIGVPRLVNTWFDGQHIDSPARYRVILSEVIDAAEYQGRPDAVKALTQRYTSALEKIIRLAPEQYFWLHRRWKHQPAAKKGKKVA